MTAFTGSQDRGRNARKTALQSGVFASRKPRLPKKRRSETDPAADGPAAMKVRPNSIPFLFAEA